MNINSNFKKSIKSLHPHEALALANQWAKCQEAHPIDIKKFYTLRDDKITDWITEGSAIVTRVLTRDSQPIESMKEAIAANDTLLEHLNYDRWQKDKKSERVKYWKMMESIAYEEGDGVLVPLPEAEQNRLNDIYDQSLRSHKEAKKEIKKKSAQIDKTENSTSSNQSNSTTIPPKPVKPDLFIIVSFEECLELKLPEVVKALDWARSLLNRPNLSILDIDVDLVSEIEQAIIEEDLESLKNQAHTIFHQTIDGQLTPIEVYQRLTELNLNYSQALGLECHQDRYGNNHILDFGAWHQLNLSLTGLWLIEYQSVLFPNIFWYSRYDNVPTSSTAHLVRNSVSLDNRVEIDEDKLIKELSIQEQQTYPIIKLLEILHIFVDNFPRKLKKYSPKFTFRSRNEDDKPEEWELAGY